MRGGINIAVVQRAADELAKAGKPVTDRAVRDCIGSGSLTTINKYLKEIRRGEQDNFGRLGIVSDELSGLVLKLHDELRSISDAAVDEAQGKIRIAEEKFLEEKKAFETEIAAIKTELQATEDNLVLARSMYEAERRELGESRKTMAELKTKCEVSEWTITSQTEQIKKAESEARNAIAQRDHSQESAERLRRSEMEAHEQSTSMLQNEIRIASQQTREKAEELIEVTSELKHREGLLASAQDMNANLRAEIAALAAKISERNTRLDALQSKVDESVLAERAAMTAVLSTKDQLSSARVELATSIAEVSTVKSQLLAVQDALKKAQAEFASRSEPKKK